MLSFFFVVCPAPPALDRQRIDPRRRGRPDRQTRDRAWARGRDEAFRGEVPWRWCVVPLAWSNGTAPAQRSATRPDPLRRACGRVVVTATHGDRRAGAAHKKNARTERNETVSPWGQGQPPRSPCNAKERTIKPPKKKTQKEWGPRRPRATRGGGADRPASSAPLLFFFCRHFYRGKSGRVLFSRLYLFFFPEFFCLRAVSVYGARERRARAGTAQTAS